MSAPSGADTINAYHIEDTYYFRHYFDNDTIFDKLKPHYKPYDSRFEIPAKRFPEIKDYLEGRGYHLREITTPETLTVVVRKYTDHPDILFDQSVIQTGTTNYNVFLMTDQTAVDQAIDAGAQPITDTDLTLSLTDS